MGEIYKYKCNVCKNGFTAREGAGRKSSVPPLEAPTKCPKCNSTNITKGAKIAYWD